MASIFTTGTINQADAGSVGQAMVERIRDDVVAHAAWDLVEEFTPGGGAVRWYVFKCLAAQSGLPSDFFLILGRTLATGDLRGFVCEAYNSSTHVATLFANSGAGSSTTAFDASGRSTGSTFTLSTTVLPSGSGVTIPRHVRWLPSGISTKWWIIVSEDTVAIAFNGASNEFMHFGAYTWLGTLANPMPLHFAGSGTGNGNNGFTRNPALAGAAAGPLVGLTGDVASLSSTGVPSPLLGFAGRLDVNDKNLTDRRAIAECGLALANGIVGSISDSAAMGWVMGKAKRVRYGSNPPAGVAFGDAYAYNGTLWVPWIPTDGRMWDTGVAV